MIHLRPVPKPSRIKADTRALKAAAARLHEQLRAEIEPSDYHAPSQRRRQEPYWLRD